MKSGYSFAIKENMAKASVRNVNISTKHVIEIAKYIRGRKLEQAKRLLQMSIDKKRAIPLKVYTNGPGHKAGMGAGRFHVKACKEVLNALETVEANAKNKGLSTTNLKLTHIVAQKAGKQWHYGRSRRTVFKNTHIELGVEEMASEDKKSKSREQKPKTEKKTTPKAEDKTAPTEAK